MLQVAALTTNTVKAKNENKKILFLSPKYHKIFVMLYAWKFEVQQSFTFEISKKLWRRPYLGNFNTKNQDTWNTSFLTGPWNIHMLFLQYSWKYMSLTHLGLDLLWNNPRCKLSNIYNSYLYVKTLPAQHRFLPDLSLIAFLWQGRVHYHKHFRKYYFVNALKLTNFVAEDLNSQIPWTYSIYSSLFFSVWSISSISLSQMVLFQRGIRCCLLDQSYPFRHNTENLYRFWFLMEISWIFLADHLKIQKMCDEAFRIESYSLHHVTDKYKNQEMCNEPMCIRPISFYLIPDHLKTKRCVFKQLRNIHGMCSMTLIEKCVMIWWEAKTLAIFSWLVCDTIASKNMAFIIITGNYYYYR